MDEKKVQEIFSDEEFVVSLLKMETPEEVQTAVKDKGLELSISDIQWIKARLVSGKTGELSAEELEGVSGGVILTAGCICSCLSLMGLGGAAALGAIGGIGIGTIGGVDWYKRFSALGMDLSRW